MNSPESVIDLIKKETIKFVELRFTDIHGAWHGLGLSTKQITLEDLTRGVTFDGSSFENWTDPHCSDLILLPDFATALIDPSRKVLTLQLICSVVNIDGTDYARDPRGAAIKAQDYLSTFSEFNGVSIGPELEFFMFDDVRFECAYNSASYALDDEEGLYNSNKTYAGGNLASRTSVGHGMHILGPADRSRLVREKIVMQLEGVDIPVTKHHHESIASQHEIGVDHADLVKTSDRIQLSKHIAKNTAFASGKSLTFMPKPVALGLGSGMHLHISLHKEGANAFSGKCYSNLSELALFFIGGVFRHGKALNALCNATTNSYKRLFSLAPAGPCFQFGAGNRATTIRIPHALNVNDSRIEIRFPDATANPYLALAAIVMAGVDGIEDSIDPGEPQLANLNSTPTAARKMAASFDEALASLNEDRAFLLKGGVFTNGLINAYIISKNAEIQSSRVTPTPLEFQNSYSC